MSKVRILIVDDEKLIRQGLRTLLELESDFEVVGEAANGREAIKKFEELRPDIVLMDVRMPEMNGVEATRAICTTYEEAKIIILTTFNEEEFLFEGIRAGATGYLLKDVSSDELSQAIRVVKSGGAMIQPEVATSLLKEFSSLERRPRERAEIALTEREKEIVRLIAKGMTNAEIAKKLFLSEGTVKNYITAILQKTGAKNRATLIEISRRAGLLE